MKGQSLVFYYKCWTSDLPRKEHWKPYPVLILKSFRHPVEIVSDIESETGDFVVGMRYPWIVNEYYGIHHKLTSIKRLFNKHS